MGVVLQAEDPQLQRGVAIKLLSLESGNVSEAQQRFLREARAVAKLNHPNVVVIHEIDEEAGRPYIVTELAAGGSLQRWIEQEGPLSWQAATRSIADACRGLAAAHAAGLIHRDIKPANLLRSESDTVKLADFGLAKGPQDSTTLTAAGTIFGTPHYMSPEQWASEPLTELSDIYSLGGTYFTLLTGEPPFGNKEPLQIMYACCSGTVPDPKAIVPDLPEACCAIVRRAMARELDERYPSAERMLADLEGLLVNPELVGKGSATGTLHDLPTVKTKLESVASSPKPVSRRRILGWGIGAVAVLGAAAWLWPRNEWEPIFNRRDLSNWDVQGNWKVEEGVLFGSGENAMLLTKRRDLRNFELRAEVKLTGEVQGGIILRANPIGEGRTGYRVNLTTGDLGGVERLLTGSEPRGLFSDGRAIDLERWENLEATFEGTGLQVRSGGRTTAEITESQEADPQLVPQAGGIGLQILGGAGHVAIRKLEIRELR